LLFYTGIKYKLEFAAQPERAGIRESQFFHTFRFWW